MIHSRFFHFLFILFAIVISHSCKVNEGNDGSGILKLIPNERWLYGNSSSVYLFDDTNQLSISSVTKLTDDKWIRSKHNTSFGILETTLWIRLDLGTNTDIEKWILSIDSPSLPYVKFYYVPFGEKEYKSLAAGRRVPKYEMAYPNKHPLFPFILKNKEVKRFYLQIQTAGPTLVPLRFFSEEAYIPFSKLTDIISGAYYGAMILLFCYNLVLFISLREKLFIYYCLYILSFVFFLFNSMNQWMPFIDYSQNITIIMLGPITSLISTIAVNFFALAFLFPKKENSKMEKAFKISILVAFLSLVSLHFLSLMQQVFIANVVPTISIFLISIAAVTRFKQGYSGARNFLIAWSFLIVSILLYIAMNLGLTDYSSFIAYSPMYGSFLEGVFLSLGIGDRINSLTKDKESARKELLLSKERALEEEKKINESISRFVPNQFLEILKRKTILEVYRGDSVEQNLSILFSDIRNFTELSESKSAKEVFNILNEYMERLGPIISNHNGFIDKYIGDAIMALFPGGPNDAVNAALEMKKEVDCMRDQIIKDFTLNAGFGIHHGSVMLGTVGEANRLDTTVIGDNVNLASRLEGLTKYYGISLIVSDSVCRGVNESNSLQFREIDSVIVKGKSLPVVIYEVLNAESESIIELKNKTYPQFFAGQQEYRSRNFSRALDLFDECLAICPTDSVAKVYKMRINEFILRPPAEDWTGLLKF
ncbi:MAG: 7TM diverse intracellular signaling domain-containing protein [Leptospira sp.]|nr:7TM diverse intracellular signaling domain-containing protein [Leptospira sp.]